MLIEPQALVTDGGFTLRQAEAIARQVERGTAPHNQAANQLELIELGVPTALACVLTDQIADMRSIEFNGTRGDAAALTELGIDPAVAKHFADAINAADPEQTVGP